MVVSIVRFRSKLSADEVQAKFEDRADDALAVVRPDLASAPTR